MSLSLCMIVRNEEENLARCLNSVKGLVQEIIVVDTGSADGTAEVAASFGAKLFFHAWQESFSEARNYALAQASGDWILVMDADDELAPGEEARLLALIGQNDPNIDVYCCETLCYSGDAPDAANALVASTVRLIRNRQGYRYSGRVHEQLCSPAAECGCGSWMKETDIRFFHYGYLNGQVEKKKKHERNLLLIQKELTDSSNDPFMLFNLGNEYFALGETERAMDCYLRSYRNFDPRRGFSSMLLTRLIACCDRLHRNDEVCGFLRAGREFYPRLTDIEFMRGAAYERRCRWEAAIRSYKKCIKMGEAASGEVSLSGVGTFRPELALAGIYARLGDLPSAVLHCRRAVRTNPAYREAFSLLLDLLLQQGKSAAAAKNCLGKLVPFGAEPLLMLSDLFYDRGLFCEGLTFARKARELSLENAEARYDEGVCRFFLGQYRAAARCLRQADGSYRSRVALFLLLARVFTGRAAPEKLWERLDPAYAAVFRCFVSLLAGEDCAPLAATEEESQQYLGPMFQLLEILLKAKRTEEFQKAVPLLNLIEDRDVLLRLGKLYYRCGFDASAFRELERSIKLTGRIDAEGLLIMHRALPK